MRFNLKHSPGMKFKIRDYSNMLAAVYPGLYCPRCGSHEIGLSRLFNGNAIWKCRDCVTDFKLIFPKTQRF